MKRVILLVMLTFGLLSGFQLQTFAESTAGCKTECSTCASICERTLSYCNKHGGKHTQPNHVKALKDCISTCKQSADFMLRNSQLQNAACSLCEQACTKCAESCEAFAGDKTMKSCAEECRKCAESCKEMSS